MKKLLALLFCFALSAAAHAQTFVLGTNTNDNALASYVGEYIETIKLVGAGVALTSATATTVVSISLTAGDWDVDGVGYFSNPGTTSYTGSVTSLSLVTNTLDTTPGRYAEHIFAAAVPGANTFSEAVPNYRFSLSATTTIFLVLLDIHTVSTSNGFGIIRARRIR